MKKTLVSLSCLLFVVTFTHSQKIKVDQFDKVIISPHIEAVLKKGDKPLVMLESATLPKEKVNIEVKSRTLWIYLEGAKIINGKNKSKNGKNKSKVKSNHHVVYKGTGTMAKVIIYYENLESLSIRGSQDILCEGLLEKETFSLSLYGEPRVTLEEIKMKDIKISVYGEGVLNIKKGTVGQEKFQIYGDGQIDALRVSADYSKINTYGDNTLKLNVSKEIKITSFGDPSILYKGDARIRHSISVGNSTVKKLD